MLGVFLRFALVLIAGQVIRFFSKKCKETRKSQKLSGNFELAKTSWNNGFLIAIEGNIGAGKTALMTRLAQGSQKANFRIQTLYGK